VPLHLRQRAWPTIIAQHDIDHLVISPVHLDPNALGITLHLVRLLEKGFWTRRDPARARQLLERALQLGDGASCKEIGKP
jgi:hypothetical protein